MTTPTTTQRPTTVQYASELTEAQQPLPRASIIIVNTNELHHLKRCLPSIAAQRYPDYEVLIVDNVSTDGSQEYIEHEFPWIRLIKNRANLGYTGANNVGFRHATGSYIAVLNPDTQVEPDWLRELVLALQQNPQAGMSTPKVLMMDNPSRINTCGNDITLTGLTVCRGLNQAATRYDQPDHVSAVSGAAFVIKRSVLDEIGVFDESFFIYYEDTDLSLRALLAGYVCLYVPTSVVYHKYTFRFSARKCFYQERNRYFSLLKIFRWRTFIALLPMLIVAEIIAWGYITLQGKDHMRSKLGSYAWVIANWGAILRARRTVQATRRVDDRVVLELLNHRLTFAQTVHPWAATLLEAMAKPVLFLLGRATRSVVHW
jgi:hypothetical protein